MRPSTIFAATWNDGLFSFTGKTRHHELAGHGIPAIAPDGQGSILAVIDGRSLCRRTLDGEWLTIATSDLPLACVVAAGEVVYLGTDNTHVLRVNRDGRIIPLSGFDVVAGRETWYAGTVILNGQLVGPPLGIRSMATTSDGKILLVNVHVGGIPRSTDGGVTWQPTIDVNSDVHEVCAHPIHSDIVIAAAAIGLCVSRDGGATWTVEKEGLHEPYCSAVAFAGNDILVAASSDHFATHGAVYRRSIDGQSPLVPIDGPPRWTDGIADTGCLATCASVLAVADKSGKLYVSTDAGRNWSRYASDLPVMSRVLIV